MDGVRNARGGVLAQDAQEHWVSIPGAEGYEVSSLGFVREVGSEISPISIDSDGYLRVSINKQNRYVHRLVMEGFVGPKPEGLQTRHLDGDSTNNKITNLKYGTRSENMQDRIRHGTNPNSKKTHCKRGHEFSGDNLVLRAGENGRSCRRCINEVYNVRAKVRQGKGSSVGVGKGNWIHTPATHCKAGHELNEENTRINPKNNKRVCRACHRRRAAESRARLELGSK